MKNYEFLGGEPLNERAETRTIKGKTYTMKRKSWLDKIKSALDSKPKRGSDDAPTPDKPLDDMSRSEYEAYLKSFLSPEVYKKHYADHKTGDAMFKEDVDIEYEQETVDVQFEENGFIVPLTDTSTFAENYRLTLESGEHVEVDFDEIVSINRLSMKLNEDKTEEMVSRALMSEDGFASVLEFAEGFEK